MALFGRKSKQGHRCPECRFYVMLEGHGYCAIAAPSNVDVRMLSENGIRRWCVRCPEGMTCPSWLAQ